MTQDMLESTLDAAYGLEIDATEVEGVTVTNPVTP